MKHSSSRRSFLGLTGAAGASVTFHAGEKFIHKLIPYVVPAEKLTF